MHCILTGMYIDYIMMNLKDRINKYPKAEETFKEIVCGWVFYMLQNLSWRSYEIQCWRHIQALQHILASGNFPTQFHFSTQNNSRIIISHVTISAHRHVKYIYSAYTSTPWYANWPPPLCMRDTLSLDAPRIAMVPIILYKIEMSAGSFCHSLFWRSTTVL